MNQNVDLISEINDLKREKRSLIDDAKGKIKAASNKSQPPENYAYFTNLK